MGVVVSAADIEHVAGIYRTLGASEVRGSGNGIRLRLADITVEIRQSDSEGGAPDRLQSVTLGGGPTPAYREALLAGPFAGWLIGDQEL